MNVFLKNFAQKVLKNNCNNVFADNDFSKFAKISCRCFQPLVAHFRIIKTWSVHLKFCASAFLMCGVFAGAQITQPLTDTSVVETETVSMECQVAQPGSRGKWMKNGKEIDTSSMTRYHTSSEGCTQRLVIKDVNGQDSGHYSYQVGRALTSASLQVMSESCLCFFAAL